MRELHFVKPELVQLFGFFWEQLKTITKGIHFGNNNNGVSKAEWRKPSGARNQYFFLSSWSNVVEWKLEAREGNSKKLWSMKTSEEAFFSSSRDSSLCVAFVDKCQREQTFTQILISHSPLSLSLSLSLSRFTFPHTHKHTLFTFPLSLSLSLSVPTNTQWHIE